MSHELCLLNPSFLATKELCAKTYAQVAIKKSKPPFPLGRSTPEKGKNVFVSQPFFQGLWLSVFRSVFSLSNKRYILTGGIFSSYRHVKCTDIWSVLRFNISKLCVFYLFFRVAPHLPTFAFKPQRPCRKRVWWGTSGFLVKLRKDVVFRWIDGNCPSVIHGSVKNGCISNNNSYCYFQISRQFPLNHDYGRKSSISSYKLNFHEFSRVKHSFPSMKIGEKSSWELSRVFVRQE